MMIAQRGGAHLITDGGVWDEDGVCTGIGGKVATFPALSMAIGYTGFGGHPEWIEEAVEGTGASSRTGVLGAMPAVLTDLVDRHGSRAPDKGLMLHVIAYDPSPASACFVISSDGATLPPDYQPFTLRRVSGFVDFADPSAVLGRPVVLTDPASFDVVADGAALARAARLTPWDRPGGSSYSVAAFADLTSVGSRGLTRRRLCDWPEDRVGERIDPFKRAA